MSQAPESMHMLVNLFSPRGIPADYRHQQGFGVDTYKWVDAQGETRLVNYHWLPTCGVASMTEADAAAVQADDLGPASKDLFDAIERGEYPEWELHVQMMDDHDHPELDFDPPDDTKVWPEEVFPPRKVGTLQLNRNVANNFAENEQISFGTGVLVDGLDFSDDKMLVGRTFSYSDTQRYRVGPNCLQLPVNAPRNGPPATNQRDGQMTYVVDTGGENPHVNYEPSAMGGLTEADYPHPDEQGPKLTGRLTRARPPRTNDYAQAGERFLLMQDWERDDLVGNLVANIGEATDEVRRRMVWHLFLCEDELGRRVGEGLGITADDVRDLTPLETQTLDDGERKRLENLGANGPRDVEGHTMTHCVPNEHRRVPG
ncbi:catalase [Pseudonocardia antarctica]|uniref:catalase n=2 Tax=Pseudonocardia alni TaxID=33907 RepID=A0A852VV16_PSEA5|nr:catalase [Pseudonocardia antarctica]